MERNLRNLFYLFNYIMGKYKMKGVGLLLNMYGGATEEIEKCHEQYKQKHKDLIKQHNELSEQIKTAKQNNEPKKEINKMIMSANKLRKEIEFVVSQFKVCEEKVLELLKNVNEMSNSIINQNK